MQAGKESVLSVPPSLTEVAVEYTREWMNESDLIDSCRLLLS